MLNVDDHVTPTRLLVLVIHVHMVQKSPVGQCGALTIQIHDPSYSHTSPSFIQSSSGKGSLSALLSTCFTTRIAPYTQRYFYVEIIAFLPFLKLIVKGSTAVQTFLVGFNYIHDTQEHIYSPPFCGQVALDLGLHQCIACLYQKQEKDAAYNHIFSTLVFFIMHFMFMLYTIKRKKMHHTTILSPLQWFL